jgi:hypothetical protein
MKILFLFVIVCFSLCNCNKIPNREQITINVISVNGIPYVEGSEIELEYGSEADVVFEFSTVTEVDYAYVKLTDGLNNEVINSSDDQNITNHPQSGDINGSFKYTIKTAEQFEEPIGNPVVDRKRLRVIIMNKLGTVEELNLSILTL